MKISCIIVKVISLALVLCALFSITSCSLTDKLFGKDAAPKSFDEIVYALEVKCKKVTVGKIENEIAPQYVNDIPVYIFDFIPPKDGGVYTTDRANLRKNPNVVNIEWEIFPHLATCQEVKFIFDQDSGVAVFDQSTNSFIFLKGDVMIDITIMVLDGTNTKTTIKVLGRTTEQ